MSGVGGTNYVSLASSFFGAFIAVYLTPDTLFRYTTHNELWIFFFGILTVFSLIFTISYSYIYREVKHDLGWNSRMLLLSFIQMTLLLTTLKLVMDSLTHEFATTHLTVIDYMIYFYLAIIVIFVILLKMQSLIEQTGVQALPSSKYKKGKHNKKSVL